MEVQLGVAPADGAVDVRPALLVGDLEAQRAEEGQGLVQRNAGEQGDHGLAAHPTSSFLRASITRRPTRPAAPAGLFPSRHVPRRPCPCPSRVQRAGDSVPLDGVRGDAVVAEARRR
jgi:hypothetical protein